MMRDMLPRGAMDSRYADRSGTNIASGRQSLPKRNIVHRDWFGWKSPSRNGISYRVVERLWNRCLDY